MTTHNIISMSQLARLFACHGAAFMNQMFPDQEQSKAAAEGTLFHDICEAVMNDYVFERHPFEEALAMHKAKAADEDMWIHVVATCEALRNQFKQVGADKIKELAFEKKFILSEELNIGGTVDVAYIVELEDGNRVLVIWDHKYGTFTVEVEDNYQLKGYVSAINADPEWGPIDRAVVHINQPRAEHPDGTLRRAKVSKEQISDFTLKLLDLGKTIKKELDNNTPTFNPGEHCKFCVANGKCAAQLVSIQKEAEMEFLPTEPKTRPQLPSPEVLTTQQKQALVKYRKIFEQFLKATEKAVTDEMKQGAEYPELKLVRARTRRGWKDDVDSIVKVLVEAGMDEEKTHEKKVCTLNAVTKALGKKKSDEIFSEWTDKPEGAVQVAPLDDKRVAIAAKATEDFKE